LLSAYKVEEFAPADQSEANESNDGFLDGTGAVVVLVAAIVVLMCILAGACCYFIDCRDPEVNKRTPVL
jgi:hypothetical protein